MLLQNKLMKMVLLWVSLAWTFVLIFWLLPGSVPLISWHSPAPLPPLRAQFLAHVRSSRRM